jgi:tetratricopeptide (TPR) repeat protein
MSGKRRKARGQTQRAPVRAVEPEPAVADRLEEPAPAPSRAPWIALGAVVAVAAVAVYLNSLPNGFVFDDADVVLGDPRIRSLGLGTILGDSYRPLRTLTYAIDYAIWGMNPTGFRITNIAIHAVNAILALLVALRLEGRYRVAAAGAALLFALHPVQVESVAYISGRRDVLFALFYLAAFLCYARYRDEVDRTRRILLLAATALLFALSLMSKEMAASFPILCVVWDLYRASAPDASGARPSTRDLLRRVVREGAALYATGVVAIAAFAYYTIVVRGATTRIEGTDVEFWGGSFANNLLTVPLTYAHYVKLAVWPVGLAAQYYGAFDPADGLADPRVLPALLLLAGLVAVACYLVLRTRARAIGFGIAWFLVTLLPASQIVPHHEIVADHYLYLPVLGLGIALAGALATVAERASPTTARAAYGLLAIALVALGAATVVRNDDWRDEATLWEATYHAVPESPRAAYNYGLVLTGRREHEQAARLYTEAIERDPTFTMAYFNLASTYAGLGRTDEARAVYERALASDIETASRRWHTTPDILRAMYQTELAVVDAKTGRADEALGELERIVVAHPDLLRAEEAYASALQSRGALQSAIDRREAQLAVTPDSPADRKVLGALLWRAGRLDEAREELERALALEPTSALASFYLAQYYGEIRPSSAPSPTAAAEAWERAERYALTPFDADAIRRARRGDASIG